LQSLQLIAAPRDDRADLSHSLSVCLSVEVMLLRRETNMPPALSLSVPVPVLLPQDVETMAKEL
jgi:hypothetical protein